MNTDIKTKWLKALRSGEYKQGKQSLRPTEDTFCCLGEVLILAYHEHFKHFALGELDLNLIEEIGSMSEDLNFRLADYQNDFGFVKDLQIDNIKKTLLTREFQNR